MPTYRNDGKDILVMHGVSFAPGINQTIGWAIEHSDLTFVSDWPSVITPEKHAASHKDGGSDDLLSAPGPVGQGTADKGAFTELKASTDPVDEHGVGDRGFNDSRYAANDFAATTITDPALNAAVSTSIIDAYGGVIITLTGAGNAQTLQPPTDTSKIKRFVVVTDDGNGVYTIEVNGITMSAGEAQRFIWDGSAWIPVTAVDADDIAFTPVGDITETNTQEAVAGVDTRKMKRVVSVDNEIARFDSAGGDVQGYTSKAPTVSDDGAINIPGNITHVPSATGTQEVVSIVPSAALVGADCHWDGIKIDGAALDPGDADNIVHGICVDFSGVDVTNVPRIGAVCLNVPTNYHALHIANGDVRHDYITPTDAGAQWTAHRIVMDGTNLDVASTANIFDVSVAGGTPSGDVCALATCSDIMPICQSIGSFTSPSQTEFAGRKTGGGSAWVDGIDTIEFFVVNSDELYIGSVAQFSQIEVVMSSVATRDTVPTFWYSTGADIWTQFYPSDGTNGFQNSGIISIILADISGLWTGDGDPGGEDTTAGYWIKIIRTVAPDPGTPTATTMKTGIITNHSWDKNGNLTIKGLTVNDPINVDDNILSKPEIKDYSETKTAPTSASNVLTLDIENGNVFSTLLTENVTTLNFNNPSASGKACSFTWIATQHSSAVTVAWPASVKWDSGTAPTITANNGIYVFTFVTVDAGTTWYGFLAGSEMAVPA